MTQLTEAAIQAIMQSDMKLWELAQTEEPTPGVIIKSLDLPFGIGPVEIRMEGITDAGSRRNAVSQFAEYVRSVIADKTDDEAVEARAIQAAARVEQRDSESSLRSSPGGVPNTRPVKETIQGAAEAQQELAEASAGLGATLATRRTTLDGLIGRAEDNLTRWRAEARALDAALAVLKEDAHGTPADTGTPEQCPASEVVREEE